MKASIILPTYNERENICDLIESLEDSLAPMGCAAEIIVVDDNSPDGTAQMVQEFQKQARVDVVCLVRTQERGLATAIRYGIEHCTGDRILVMDTDFNHDPGLIPQMIALLDEWDLVIGSRFVKNGGMEDRRRNLYSWAYNVFIRVMLFSPVHDNLSGFFSMRREKLFALNFQPIFLGYGEYFIRLIYAARKKGCRILEIPVFYKLRQHGDSKSQFGSMIHDYTLCVFSLLKIPHQDLVQPGQSQIETRLHE